MAGRLLDSKTSVLLVVDIQEKFAGVVRESGALLRKAGILVEAAKALGVPVLVSEQYPQGLGHTAADLLSALGPGARILEKTAFGCLGDEAIARALRETGRTQAVLCGIEAHICVNQTAHQLIAAGYETHLVEDAVSAREEANKDAGLRKMRAAGVLPSCVEMVLFEWMRHSKHAEFKRLQALIK